ncbi:carboxylating nicotinate-nucleotide diphosphorylase [Paraglaciecola hydrolytica]|uniref:Probable nicotinate-nucleotide pyrophosphorylase [carboxylating] n=1 Tax=Paraglaciecola hydrolytica TaxID=1799789 RepID=A0A148KKP6_9ALTE|nr:carboxylating nicotinate-nucleotide diphosphorylase [Paraglaciecola hydrolytica]KXI26835.1 nicotinate-nucleotide pyrophosphorylase [Paraglaciecola hydrolytica]
MLQKHIKQAVSFALWEDLGGKSVEEGDITANLIPVEQTITADVITREACILAGSAWVTETFQQLDPTIKLQWFAKDSDKLSAGQRIFQVSGPARALLTGERTALNFLQTLSATATLTAQCVEELKGTHTQLLDTRKTLPGLRMAQKYAVTCGGGKNHRIGLFDAFLIKENHILACGSIAQAVSRARMQHPDLPVEVEVENLDELAQGINAGADIIMLDNFSVPMIKQAVELNQRKAKLEVSGNVTRDQLKILAATGIDFISSGALTKHVNAIDLSFRVIAKG